MMPNIKIKFVKNIFYKQKVKTSQWETPPRSLSPVTAPSTGMRSSPEDIFSARALSTGVDAEDLMSRLAVDAEGNFSPRMQSKLLKSITTDGAVNDLHDRNVRTNECVQFIPGGAMARPYLDEYYAQRVNLGIDEFVMTPGEETLKPRVNLDGNTKNKKNYSSKQ